MHNVEIRSSQKRAYVFADRLEELNRWKNFAAYRHMPYVITRTSKRKPRYTLIIFGLEKDLMKIVVENWR